MKLKNNYIILRHGQAASNQSQVLSSWPEKFKNHLTKKGVKEVQKIIPKLKKERIDLIFASDLLRAKQAAQIIAEKLKLKVNFDKRLREVNVGTFNGKSVKKWNMFFANNLERFIKKSPRGENRREIKKRMIDFIKDINRKYSNKNILIVGHQDPLIILQGSVKELSEKEISKQWQKLKINPAEYRKL